MPLFDISGFSTPMKCLIVAVYFVVLRTIGHVVKGYIRSRKNAQQTNHETTSFTRSIAVVIPTLNETTALPGTIERLFDNAKKADQQGETGLSSSIHVVVVDASQDGSATESCLSSLMADHPSLHLAKYTGKPSRGLQMNFGADHAAKIAPEASVLVFLHADTYLPPAWDQTIFDNLFTTSDPPVLGCFRLSLPPPTSLSLDIMLLTANLRAILFGLPYGDQCYFLTRKNFDMLGGFPGVPIMEDVGLLRRVSKHGRVQVADIAVETSKRRWERNGVWWNTLLNQVFMTAWMCGTPPETIYRWYYGTRKGDKQS